MANRSDASCAQLRDRQDPVVLLVSDVRLYREALGGGLVDRPGLALAGCCAGDEALGWLERKAIDVVLLDASLSMGLLLARQIRGSHPRVRTLALAIAADPQRVLDCAEAGFAGYLGSEVGIDGLVEAVNQSVRGELSCSPQIAALLFQRLGTISGRRSAAAAPCQMRRANLDLVLTAREAEISSLIECGLTNKEIALRLQISAATVKNHVHKILEKLNVPRRAAIRARIAAVRPSHQIS